jgi:5-methylthioadenosine/S-adenosylhomocysteine deaminase
MRLAMMLPRIATSDHTAWPSGRTALDMATINGAAVLGHRNDLGRIIPGALADLVLIRRTTAATLSMDATENALVQHASPDAVSAVMVDGTWVFRDGRILAFDEAAAIAEAGAVIADLQARTAHRRVEIAALLPALSARLAAV